MKKITTLNFKTLLLGICLLLTFLTTNAQIQKGADIDGEAAGDGSGYSVSMPDANTVAIGAPSVDGIGYVRIYSWSGTAWVQRGADIDGEAAGHDWAGYSVSMPDLNTVAISQTFFFLSDTVNWLGSVRIFTWDGVGWRQKGADIDGEAAGGGSGYSVSMPDANTVAISRAFGNDAGDTGQVRIYSWSGTAWEQRGADIDGEVAGDGSGYSVSMPDANTVAIGAPWNDAGDTSQVRIYSWSGTAWEQKGADIYGETSVDPFGFSVSMPDANTVVIGAPSVDGIGYVRIYSWSGTAWVQRGADIDGEVAGDGSGYSVSMPDANTVAIGAPLYDDDIGIGYVRIYSWSGTAWVQRGADIDGEAAGDALGFSVSMPDANTIAIGAPGNDGETGQVRVYNISNSNTLENSFGFDIKAYPIPTRDVVKIELKANYPKLSVVVRNIEGKEMIKKSFNNTNNFQIKIPGDSGIYSIEISAQDKKALLNIVKD